MTSSSPAIDHSLLDLVRLFLWGIGIVVTGITLVGIIAFWRTGQDSASKFSDLFEGGNLLKILVVVFAVNAVTLLAIAKVIDGATVASVLSGIIGYVLGGVSPKSVKTRSTPQGEDQSVQT